MIRTGHRAWRAAEDGFAAWRGDGTAVDAGGVLRLGSGVRAGEALSPVVRPGFTAREAISSWNAATPAGTWLEAGLRARLGDRWTRWYELGSWSSRNGARRRSVAGQRDARGRVETDTLVLPQPADAFQLALRLRSSREGATPSIRLAALAFSAAPRPRTLVAGDPALWGGSLGVPAYSQLDYPDGGEAWCSPTSVAMVVAYWHGSRGAAAAPLVRRVVRGTYDRGYGGHGNWSFNVAFAATQGLQAQVARFSSLREVEPWIAVGVPVVISYAWRQGQLDGADGASDGHLAVVVGFDRRGDPIVNDPAGRGADIRRTYRRRRLERLWLEHSGGTAYLIHPPRHPVPPLG